MISIQQVVDVLRLYHRESWKIETIAKHLGVHHSTVKRVLEHNGMPPGRARRASMIDEHVPFIKETLKVYPKLRGTRLYDMCRERGYKGAPDHFRHLLRKLRPRPTAEAFQRLRTLPGEQAQIDWGHFGKVKIGEAERRLMGFVMVLSWSRQIYLRFFLDATTESFLRGHVQAFLDWGGVTKHCLYDNLKSAVIERQGDAIRFNEKLLALAAHYRFEPRVAAPYRGNEKGRVERAIRFIRDRFFAARSYRDLDDLNAQAHEWTHGVASDRLWPDGDKRKVADAFSEEKTRLMALPDDSFVIEERREVSVGKTPYVRFDGNDYSIPPNYVRRTVSVWADEKRVRVIAGEEVIAQHLRSYSRRDQIEDPKHVQELMELKKESRKHRGMNRLFKAAPSTENLLKVQASRGNNIGSITARLLVLLDEYGGPALEAALVEALDKDVCHTQGLAQILDQHRRAASKGVLVPVVVDRPGLKDLHVQPHNLTDYDTLTTEEKRHAED